MAEAELRVASTAVVLKVVAMGVAVAAMPVVVMREAVTEAAIVELEPATER